MTDRAQPGAIDSIVRNDELAQVLGQFTDGSIVPGHEPTPAARRRDEIDDDVLEAFALSHSADSLTVTIAPGEAFVSGWCARDTPTEIDLPADATSEIVVGWSPDATYDPEIHDTRDEADEMIVTTASDADPDHPTAVAWVVQTDGSGVVSAERVAPVGAPDLGGGGVGEALAFDYLDVTQ